MAQLLAGIVLVIPLQDATSPLVHLCPAKFAWETWQVPVGDLPRQMVRSATYGMTSIQSVHEITSGEVQMCKIDDMAPPNMGATPVRSFVLP